MNIQGFGNYNGDNVTIIDSYKDKLLIVNTAGETTWIVYTEITNVTWVINTNVA